MAHQSKGQHWRSMGKPDAGPMPDNSTSAILDVLHTARDPHKLTTAHAGVASVGASGTRATGPKTGKNVAANAATNDALDNGPARGVPHKQPSIGDLIGAGIITPQ